MVGQALSHSVMVSLQVNTILTHKMNVLLIFHLGDNIGTVLPGLQKNLFSTDFRSSVKATEGI